MYLNTDANWQEGHVSAGSAAGLLAKVYATMAAAALPEGTEIIVRSGAPYTGTGSSRVYAPLQTFTFKKQAIAGYEAMDAKALYTKAAEWAEKVIKGEYGSYELLPYSALWKKANATASEFMFSIPSAVLVEMLLTRQPSIHNTKDTIQPQAPVSYRVEAG